MWLYSVFLAKRSWNPLVTYHAPSQPMRGFYLWEPWPNERRGQMERHYCNDSIPVGSLF